MNLDGHLEEGEIHQARIVKINLIRLLMAVEELGYHGVMDEATSPSSSCFSAHAAYCWRTRSCPALQEIFHSICRCDTLVGPTYVRQKISPEPDGDQRHLLSFWSTFSQAWVFTISDFHTDFHKSKPGTSPWTLVRSTGVEHRKAELCPWFSKLTLTYP